MYNVNKLFTTIK